MGPTAGLGRFGKGIYLWYYRPSVMTLELWNQFRALFV